MVNKARKVTAFIFAVLTVGVAALLFWLATSGASKGAELYMNAAGGFKSVLGVAVIGILVIYALYRIFLYFGAEEKS